MDCKKSALGLLTQIDGIPTLEASKMRLFEILQDDEADTERLEGLISSDPAMAAKIIKLANSPFYRHAREPFGIHQAMLTVGIDMVKCLALTMAVMDTLHSESLYARALWAHSYATGLISLSLCRDRSEKDHLFTGALLHDLGRMVYLFKLPEIYIPLIEFDGSWPDISLERDALGSDHAAVGEAIACMWRFPEQVVEIIRDHHVPQGRLSALVSLVNRVVCMLERGENVHETPCDEQIRHHLGGDYKDLVNTILQRYKLNSAIIENLY